MRIGGTKPNPLAASSQQGFMSEFILTNPDLRQRNGTALAKQSVGITWQRTVQAIDLTVCDVIKLTNHAADSIQIDLSFDFQADFADIFEIRGLHPRKIGRSEKPAWKRGVLWFNMMGPMAFFVLYGLTYDHLPLATRKNGANLKLSLAPNETSRSTYRSRFLNHLKRKERSRKAIPIQIRARSQAVFAKAPVSGWGVTLNWIATARF